MTMTMKQSIDEYFRSLDICLKGTNNRSDDVVHYHASGISIQSSFALPIIIQYAGTRVNFNFSSNPSDITFGIEFASSLMAGDDNSISSDVCDVKMQTVLEMKKVNCNKGPLIGTFKVPVQGMLFFLWENESSSDFWSSGNRTLSYKISTSQTDDQSSDDNSIHNDTTVQPSSIHSDQVLKEKAIIELNKCLEEVEVSRWKLSMATDCLADTTGDIESLEVTIGTLQTQLQVLREQQQSMRREWDEVVAVLQTNKTLTNGACMRLLNKKLLCIVFSFLLDKGEAGSNIHQVCRYWRVLCVQVMSCPSIEEMEEEEETIEQFLNYKSILVTDSETLAISVFKDNTVDESSVEADVQKLKAWIVVEGGGLELIPASSSSTSYIDEEEIGNEKEEDEEVVKVTSTVRKEKPTFWGELLK